MAHEGETTHHRIHVLVIDDDKVDRLTVRDLLEESFIVHDAASDAEAREILAKGQIDCVLLDYLIPGTDSLEFLSELATKGLPVIVLTGEGNEDVAVQAMKCGAQDYIVKRSLTTEHLSKTISSAVDTIDLKQRLATTTDSLKTKVHELEQLNGDLESFIHIVAHDLREPLRSLHGYCDLLEREIQTELSPECKGYLDSVRRTARRLASSIDNLRELTRVVYGVGEEAKFLLDHIVDDLLKEFEIDNLAQRIKVIRDPLPSLTAMQPLMRELYWNLISNALKYAKGEDVLLHFSAQQEGDQIVLGLRNTGSSIPAAELEKVLQPFYRVAATRAKEGAGMGLSLCKRISERHGGKMWIESDDTLGVHVRFTLGKERYGNH